MCGSSIVCHCGEAGGVVAIIQEAERHSSVRPVAVRLERWLEPPHIAHIVPMLEACNYAYDTLQMT